jgi:hypothetical protein
MKLIQFILWTIIAVITVLFTLAVLIGMALPSEEELQQSVDDLYAQTAFDAEQQYQMVRAGGNLIEMCVHAGLVAAAYVQANDEANYQKWNVIRAQDCNKAGMPNY